MRNVLAILNLFFIVAFVACGPDGPSAEELAAEAEANRLDSIDQVIDSTVVELESTADELSTALDSLDALIPVEE